MIDPSLEDLAIQATAAEGLIDTLSRQLLNLKAVLAEMKVILAEMRSDP